VPWARFRTEIETTSPVIGLLGLVFRTQLPNPAHDFCQGSQTVHPILRPHRHPMAPHRPVGKLQYLDGVADATLFQRHQPKPAVLSGRDETPHRPRFDDHICGIERLAPVRDALKPWFVGSQHLANRSRKSRKRRDFPKPMTLPAHHGRRIGRVCRDQGKNCRQRDADRRPSIPIPMPIFRIEGSPWRRDRNLLHHLRERGHAATQLPSSPRNATGDLDRRGGTGDPALLEGDEPRVAIMTGGDEAP